MKIVIDARESGTSTGRYVDKLVEHLHSLRPEYQMVILTKRHRMEYLKRVAPSFEIIETPYKEFTFGEQLGFKKQLDALKADLVHFAMVQQPIMYRGKVVTTMHDLTTLRFRNPAKNPIVFGLRQQIYKWVNRRAASKSAAIIAPTEYVKKDVVQFAGIAASKVTVTLEAADKITEKAEPFKPAHGKKFLLYVGRPQPHKNLDRLVEAFALAQESHPDLYLVLAGKMDVNYLALQRRVADKNVNNVLFTDWVNDGQLKWLYENALAYVFPSLSEGFGLPGLEAMLYGLPVISSNATCLPEVYGEAAIYFDPMDTKAMAEAIMQVLDDPKLRQDLALRGQKQAAKYSWERLAKQTLLVYDKVLGQ